MREYTYTTKKTKEENICRYVKQKLQKEKFTKYYNIIIIILYSYMQMI